MDTPRMIALLGAKGGCGVTTITANLAANIHGDGGVCAVDLDHGKGDLAAMLDLEPGQTVPELLARECDPSLLRGCAKHHGAGFDVLGQPKDMSELVRPSADEVRRFLEVVRRTWAVTLLDCGSRVDDAVIAALRVVDMVAIVTTPDLLALRDAARERTLLTRLGIGPERQWWIVNQVGRGISVPELEEVLGVSTAAALPRDDAACAKAVTTGALLQVAAPHGALSRAFDGLWTNLNGEKPARHRWRLPWLWGAA